MHTFIVRSAVVAGALGALISLSGVARAQWLHYPTPRVPRAADGKPNLSAPAPKTLDGKPDLSGIWLTAGTECQDPEKLTCGRLELPMGKEGVNMGVSLPDGLPSYLHGHSVLSRASSRHPAGKRGHGRVTLIPDAVLAVTGTTARSASPGQSGSDPGGAGPGSRKAVSSR
jgi:hypothetical protein